MIEINDLHKSFGRQAVLCGVNLTIAAGQTTVILGRSGSGKSVLLKCLVGLIQPERGSIRVEGVEVVGLARGKLQELRRGIGYVFQNAALYSSMTVAENMAFHLDRYRRMPASRREAIIREKLRFVGMEAAMHQYPAELSGGMQKRIGLARALVLSPRLVLYDEPTSGLDPITTAEIDRLIIRLRQEEGVTAVSITHSVESAYRTADVIAVLHAGEIVASGTCADLLQNRHPVVQQFFDLSSTPVTEKT